MQNAYSSHSESLKVKYFVVSGQTTKDQISLYNSFGLISKAAEDVALKTVKIHVFDYPTVVWRHLSKEPPRISVQTLYWQKLESLGYISVADSIDLSSFKFSVSSENARVLKQSA